MLFWIFLILIPITILIGTIVFLRADDIGRGVCWIPFTFLVVILTFIITAFWVEHAEDLATLRKQQKVVKVYKERHDNLMTVLEQFNYPTENGTVVNADKPVASVVKELSNVESKLADVKAEIAEAKKSIEARKLGPMGGIVTLMGEE